MSFFKTTTFAIMVAIALGYVLGVLLPAPLVYALMLSGVGVIGYGLYFEVFTAIFVTPSVADFLFNEIAMLWIYSFFRNEARRKEALVFLLSGVLGNVASIFFLPPYVFSSGASGGIMGVFAYYLTKDALKGAGIRGIVYALVFVGYVITFSALFFRNVNNIAHLFGALGGVIVGLSEYSLKGKKVQGH